MATYTQALVLADVQLGTHGLVSAADGLLLLNTAVRDVLSDIDLRSSKRQTASSPNLFDEIYSYACPTSMKGNKIIDVEPQTNRSVNYEFNLVTAEEFDIRKSADIGIVAFSDKSGTRKLKISTSVDDDSSIVSSLDTITSSGTWTLYGDGTNLTTDNDNYVKGNGSINWDISAAGGTTAGIYASDLDTFDLTDYIASGSVFVWTYVTSATNLTNYIIRIGSSSSNYFTQTITTTNESAAFVAGWNLLRFDFASTSETGTVDLDACDYCAIFMTKDAAKTSETDYRFDHIILKRGEYHNVQYYSKYGWQNSGGTWIENSTATTDYINAESDEIKLFVLKGKQLASEFKGNDADSNRYFQQYEQAKVEYKRAYPSEAMLLTQTYQDDLI